MSDPVKKWGATGKNTMLAEIMQTGDELVSEIEQLQAKNAELTAEVERLKAHQCTPVCVFHEGEELRKLCEQLAASQLEAKRIREQRDLAVSALEELTASGMERQ